MTAQEFNIKLAELKELTAKAEALALELREEARKQKETAADEMEEFLSSDEEIDRAKYRVLVNEESRTETNSRCIETALYKISNEVIANLEKIA